MRVQIYKFNGSIIHFYRKGKKSFFKYELIYFKSYLDRSHKFKSLEQLSHTCIYLKNTDFMEFVRSEEIELSKILSNEKKNTKE